MGDGWGFVMGGFGFNENLIIISFLVVIFLLSKKWDWGGPMKSLGSFFIRVRFPTIPPAIDEKAPSISGGGL